MGSRLMHLAIAGLVMDKNHINDPERFLYGSLLPDAAVLGNSHWRISCNGGKRQTFDLSGFRREYEKELKTDDLIRGYYLHLVQDMLMRAYLRSHASWKPGRRNSGKIHRDYTRLNRMLTETYDLSESVKMLRDHEIDHLFDGKVTFDGKALLDNVRQDVHTVSGPKAGYFTEERAKEYVAYAAERCGEELNALNEGRSSLPDDFVTWEWVKPYLITRIIRKLKRILRGGNR